MYSLNEHIRLSNLHAVSTESARSTQLGEDVANSLAGPMSSALGAKNSGPVGEIPGVNVLSGSNSRIFRSRSGLRLDREATLLVSTVGAGSLEKMEVTSPRARKPRVSDTLSPNASVEDLVTHQKQQKSRKEGQRRHDKSPVQLDATFLLESVSDTQLSSWGDGDEDDVDIHGSVPRIDDLEQLALQVNKDAARVTDQRLEDSVRQFAEEKGIATTIDPEDGDVPEFYLQGNVSMYTRENLRLRSLLRNDKQIHAVIAIWWDLLPRNSRDSITKRVYRDHYFRIYKALILDFKREVAGQAAEDEWKADVKDEGEDEMTEAIFFNSMFEIADMWCDGIEQGDYVEFLMELLEELTHDIRGTRHWKHLAEIHILERISVQTNTAFVMAAQQWEEVYPSLGESKREISELIKFLPGDGREWMRIFSEANVCTVGDLASANMPDDLKGIILEGVDPNVLEGEGIGEDGDAEEETDEEPESEMKKSLGMGNKRVVSLAKILQMNPSEKNLIRLDVEDMDIQPLQGRPGYLSGSGTQIAEKELGRYSSPARPRRPKVSFNPERSIAPADHPIDFEDDDDMDGANTNLIRSQTTPALGGDDGYSGHQRSKLILRDHNMEVLRFALREFQTSSSTVVKKQAGMTSQELMSMKHLEIDALRLLSLQQDDFVEGSRDWDAVFPTLSSIDLPIEDLVPFLGFEPIGEVNGKADAPMEEQILWRRRNWRAVFESYGITTIGELCQAKRKNYQFLKRGGMELIRLAVRNHARSGYVRHDPLIFAGPDWKRRNSSVLGPSPYSQQNVRPLSRVSSGARTQSPGMRSPYRGGTSTGTGNTPSSPDGGTMMSDGFRSGDTGPLSRASMASQKTAASQKIGFWTEIKTDHPLFPPLMESVDPIASLMPYLPKIDDAADHTRKWEKRLQEIGVHTVGQLASYDRYTLVQDLSTSELVDQVQASLTELYQKGVEHALVYPTLINHDESVRPILAVLEEEYGTQAVDEEAGLMMPWAEVFLAAGITEDSTIGELAGRPASDIRSNAALISIRRALSHFQRTLDPADFRPLYPELQHCENSVVSLLPFLAEGGSIWLPAFQYRGLSTIGLVAKTRGGRCPVILGKTIEDARSALVDALHEYAKQSEEDCLPIYPDLAGSEMKISKFVRMLSVSTIDAQGWAEQFQIRDVATVGDLAKLPRAALNTIPRINARSCILETLKHVQYEADKQAKPETIARLYPRLRGEETKCAKLVIGLPRTRDWASLFEDWKVVTIGDLANLPESECYVKGLSIKEIEELKLACRSHERMVYPSVHDRLFPPLINCDHSLAKLCAHLPGDGWVDAICRSGCYSLGELCATQVTDLDTTFFDRARLKLLKETLVKYHQDLEQQRARLIVFPFLSGDKTSVDALLKHLPKKGQARWRREFRLAGLETVGQVGMQTRAKISNLKCPHALLFVTKALERYKQDKDFEKANTLYPKLASNRDPISKLLSYMPGRGWKRTFTEAGLKTVGDLATQPMRNLPAFLEDPKLRELLRQVFDKYVDRRPRNEQVYRPLMDSTVPIGTLIEKVSTSGQDRTRWESNFKFNDMSTIGDVASADISVIEVFPKPNSLSIVREALENLAAVFGAPTQTQGRRASTYGRIKRSGSILTTRHGDSTNNLSLLHQSSTASLSVFRGGGPNLSVAGSILGDLDDNRSTISFGALSKDDLGSLRDLHSPLPVISPVASKGFRQRHFKPLRATTEQRRAAKKFVKPVIPKSPSRSVSSVSRRSTDSVHPPGTPLSARRRHRASSRLSVTTSYSKPSSADGVRVDSSLRPISVETSGHIASPRRQSLRIAVPQSPSSAVGAMPPMQFPSGAPTEASMASPNPVRSGSISAGSRRFGPPNLQKAVTSIPEADLPRKVPRPAHLRRTLSDEGGGFGQHQYQSPWDPSHATIAEAPEATAVG